MSQRALLLPGLLLCAASLGCGKTATVAPDGLAPSAINADPNPPFRSGARLRARVLDDGAGTLGFVEWHDAVLNAGCAFHLAEDGVVRCLPWQLEPAMGGNGFDIVYTDPECQLASLALPANVPAPAYTHDAGVLSALCAQLQYAVHRVGGAVASQRTVYHRNAFTGECGPIAAPLPVGTALYSLDDQVPATTFVAAERVIPKSGQRLAAIEIHGEDGSLQRAGIWDTARGEECARSPLAADICMPTVAWVENSFADAGCTIQAARPPEAVGADSRCPALALAVQPDDTDSCGHPGGVRLFELGDIVTPGRVFIVDGPSCSPSETVDAYYEIRAEVSTDTLGALSAIWVGGPRLSVEGIVEPGGARLDDAPSSARLFDQLAKSVCRPATTCGGELACRPSAASGFGDSRCQAPVVRVAVTADCSNDVPNLVAPYAQDGACWNGDLFQVGSERGDESLYGMTNGDCSIQENVRAEFELRPALQSSISARFLLDRVE